MTAPADGILDHGVPPRPPEEHVLGPAQIEGGAVSVSCSCGNWGQRWAQGPDAPGILTIERDHRAHALAPAPDRKRRTPPQFEPAPNPALDAIISAALAMAKAGAGAAKALEDFTDAHTAARRNGVGVLVVRRPDGTVESTPNVYLAPGTVVYTEEPGTPWVPAPFVDARAPFEAEWFPRYTAPPQDLPDVA